MMKHSVGIALEFRTVESELVEAWSKEYILRFPNLRSLRANLDAWIVGREDRSALGDPSLTFLGVGEIFMVGGEFAEGIFLVRSSFETEEEAISFNPDASEIFDTPSPNGWWVAKLLLRLEEPEYDDRWVVAAYPVFAKSRDAAEERIKCLVAADVGMLEALVWKEEREAGATVEFLSLLSCFAVVEDPRTGGAFARSASEVQESYWSEQTYLTEDEVIEQIRYLIEESTVSD